MESRKKRLPGIGMRTIKTACAVVVCILLFELMRIFSVYIDPEINIFTKIIYFLLDRQRPVFACVAATIVMQATIEDSLKIGIDRIWGTFAGGAIGLLFLFIDSSAWQGRLSTLLTGIGVIAVIYFCILIKHKLSVSIGVVTFIIIMLYPEGGNPYFYAVNRIIDTTIGIVISVLINRYLNVPERFRKTKTEETAGES